MKISDCLYFDHQASTPVAEHILLEMEPFYRESFANPHSSDHALGWKSMHAVKRATEQVGQLIGADADEIFFTSGATESNNMALLGLAKGALNNGNTRKRIVVSSIEHKCVLAIGRFLEEQYGFQVESLSVDGNGTVSLCNLESVLGNDLLAVSIMAVNNEIGTIQDIKGISELVHSSGAILHCDATQAPLAMNMQGMAREVELLSLSGHKMYAPKGIGALYIRRDQQDHIEPLIHGGGQQNGLRSGTMPTALCVGMGAAAEFLGSRQAHGMREELRLRRNKFVEKLSNLAWPTTLNGPSLEYRHPGNANIGFTGFTAHQVLGVLQPHLAASTGSACTSGITEPSHVLKATGLTTDESEASIRFSLGFDTTDDDIDHAINLIDEALNKLAGIAMAGTMTISR